jgi:hypothetical protein
MNWKKNLTVLGLAILIENTITYLFEPKWIGGPATFPQSQLHRLFWNGWRTNSYFSCFSVHSFHHFLVYNPVAYTSGY